jgi:hypothetical protein
MQDNLQDNLQDNPKDDPTDNPWTEAMVAELRCLLGQQVPYGAIARRLGVSRNAAIGKAKRLKIGPTGEAERFTEVSGPSGIPVRSRSRPAARPDLERRTPPRAFRSEAIPPAVSCDPLNLRMDQLRFFHCRYITNDDLREPTYCGRVTAEGTSWCAFHLARVRAPVRPDDVPLVPSPAGGGPSQS